MPQASMLPPAPATSQNLDIRVFPNPTRTNASVRFTLEDGAKTTITLHAMDGRPVRKILPKQRLEARTHTFEVDLAGLAQGTYHVIAMVGDRVYTKQLVKQ